MSFKIDANDPANLNPNPLAEKETRSRLLTHARIVGCEKDMLLIFAKFDKLLRLCKNKKEYDDIRKLGCVEVYRLLGGGGELYLDHNLEIKDS